MTYSVLGKVVEGANLSLLIYNGISVVDVQVTGNGENTHSIPSLTKEQADQIKALPFKNMYETEDLELGFNIHSPV